MINTAKLRGLMAEHGLTQKDVALQLGISPKTFYAKMKTQSFGIDEADKMIHLLHIENPAEIFFAH